MIALSATMAVAMVTDYASRQVVPVGVTVAGTDLSGLSAADAQTAIEQAVADPLARPVTVYADGRTFQFDPKDAVTVDIQAMIDEALAPRRQASYVDRLAHAVSGAPMTTEVEPVYAVDDAVVATWLGSVKAQIDKPAVNASITVAGSKVKLRKSEEGRTLDLAEATKVIDGAFAADQALAAGDRSVTLPVETTKPKINEKKLGKTIVVDLSERRIRLYNGVKQEVTYRCAIGSPAFPTPQGKFKIVAKRYRPTWINPGSGWAASMPRSIPPGPGNPLGTRAMNLSASGIRFHGTSKVWSIGTAASHGCMRMRMPDIEDFYDRVKIGTPVYIVP
jgi:lipoprotein-anchoring transpeptidase ErfK/SrfK